jgi:hypothetical protein
MAQKESFMDIANPTAADLVTLVEVEAKVDTRFNGHDWPKGERRKQPLVEALAMRQLIPVEIILPSEGRMVTERPEPEKPEPEKPKEAEAALGAEVAVGETGTGAGGEPSKPEGPQG